MRNPLRKLLEGTPARPPLTEWHPLEELDDEPDGIIPAPDKELTQADVDDIKAKFAASFEPVAEPAQCTATTRSGGQCKFPARPGTDRCALPSHQQPHTETEPSTEGTP